MPPLPRFPIYIPSKGRADICMTMLALNKMGVPYHVIVEDSEHDAYARVLGEKCLIVLDKTQQDRYDPCDGLARTLPLGSGPARNMAWDHAAEHGHARHWVVDDNIRGFLWFRRNQQLYAADGAPFAMMEDFVLQYRNIAMAGPNYRMFAKTRDKLPPFITGTRVFSCNLIRTDLNFRWRCRYNEDLDLSLRMLKAGWNTVLFNAFLQEKTATQTMKGGNTDTVYRGGTLAKSRMAARLHPDCTRVVWKFGRWHHETDYNKWRNRPLLRDPDAPPVRRLTPVTERGSSPAQLKKEWQRTVAARARQEAG